MLVEPGGDKPPYLKKNDRAGQQDPADEGKF